VKIGFLYLCICISTKFAFANSHEYRKIVSKTFHSGKFVSFAKSSKKNERLTFLKDINQNPFFEFQKDNIYIDVRIKKNSALVFFHKVVNGQEIRLYTSINNNKIQKMNLIFKKDPEYFYEDSTGSCSNVLLKTVGKFSLFEIPEQILENGIKIKFDHTCEKNINVILPSADRIKSFERSLLRDGAGICRGNTPTQSEINLKIDYLMERLKSEDSKIDIKCGEIAGCASYRPTSDEILINFNCGNTETVKDAAWLLNVLKKELIRKELKIGNEEPDSSELNQALSCMDGRSDIKIILSAERDAFNTGQTLDTSQFAPPPPNPSNLSEVFDRNPAGDVTRTVEGPAVEREFLAAEATVAPVLKWATDAFDVAIKSLPSNDRNQSTMVSKNVARRPSSKSESITSVSSENVSDKATAKELKLARADEENSLTPPVQSTVTVNSKKMPNTLAPANTSRDSVPKSSPGRIAASRTPGRSDERQSDSFSTRGPSSMVPIDSSQISTDIPAEILGVLPETVKSVSDLKNMKSLAEIKIVSDRLAQKNFMVIGLGKTLGQSKPNSQTKIFRYSDSNDRPRLVPVRR